MARPQGRTLYASLHFLDRQVLSESEGHGIEHTLGKVDDLVFDLAAEPPRLTALLSEPQAWSRRLPGVLGRAVVTVQRLLSSDPDRGPIVIPAGLITEVDSAVHIKLHGDLPLTRLGDGAGEHVIRRPPGATDAPE